MTTEADIQFAVRAALGQEPDLVLWRNQAGVAHHCDASGRERVVRYGLARGAADLVGVLAPGGRWVALEIKRPGGRTTDEQELFLRLVRRMGGFAAVVDSVESARAAIDRARAGAAS